MSSSDESADRTEKAFREHGLADMRPVYRALMRRLKARDERLFALATERYQSSLAPTLEAEGSDVVEAWIEYGAWLAAQLGPGRMVAVDETGMASDARVGPPPAGTALLFLPDAGQEPAVAIARPAEPSEAVATTLRLLVR